MKLYQKLLPLVLLVLLTLCSCGQNHNGSGNNDAAYRQLCQRVDVLTATSPQQALSYVDSLYDHGMLPPFMNLYLHSRIYFRRQDSYQVSINYAELAMRDSSFIKDSPHYYMSNIGNAAQAYYYLGNYKKALRLLHRVENLEREHPDDKVRLQLLVSRGACESRVSSNANTDSIFDVAIKLAQKMAAGNDNDKIDLLCQAEYIYLDVLLRQERYQMATWRLPEYERACERMQKSLEDFPGQNEDRMAEYYGTALKVYSKLGDTKRADYFYTKLMGTRLGRTPQGVTYSMDYLLANNRLDELQQQTQRLGRVYEAEGDTVNQDYVDYVLSPQWMIAHRQGNYDLSFRTGLRAPQA